MQKTTSHEKISLFSQIISLFLRNFFERLTNKYQTDKSNKDINSLTHLVSMLFCHNVLHEHFQSQHTFIRSRLSRLRRKIFILEATIIPLCLCVFNRAKFRSRKGAIKLHLPIAIGMLDNDGCLPVFADLTSGKVHEINIARRTEYPKGGVLVFDLGYIDFKWLHVLDSSVSKTNFSHTPAPSVTLGKI